MLALILLVLGLAQGLARQEPARIDELVRESQAAERERWVPAVEELGRIAARADLRQQVWAKARVNSLGMKFAALEPGRFTMGPDAHRVFDVQVAHPVAIERGFFVSVTEVTNAQYRRLVPEVELNPWSPHPDSPAVGVTWAQAERFCELLSEREGARYRLPTEAEWEYASRAGTQTRFCFGDDPGRLAEYGWYGRPEGQASPVALLAPNALGLFDMHGNAVEWVSDWYSRTYYAACAEEGVVRDPRGPERGRTHVLRGGGWPAREPLACSSTARAPLPLLDRVPFETKTVPFRQSIGFRVVRERDP